MTKHVLAAVGSPVDASAATAHGTLGAVEAVLGEALTSHILELRTRPAVGGTVARALVDHGWIVFTMVGGRLLTCSWWEPLRAMRIRRWGVINAPFKEAHLADAPTHWSTSRHCRLHRAIRATELGRSRS